MKQTTVRGWGIIIRRKDGTENLALHTNGRAFFERHKNARTFRDELKAHGMRAKIVKLTVTYEHE